MIEIKFSQKIKIKTSDFSKKELPTFAQYKTDLLEIRDFSQKFLKYQNIIIAARGGSITSFRAFYESLAKYEIKKNVFFVDTADPDFLAYVKKECPIKKTLLIVISKSGKTIDVIENYFYFQEYKTIFITTIDDNPMYQVAKIKKIPVLPHPEIGGRFSGLTATALLPAFLFGIDITKLVKGAQKAYQDFLPQKKNNLAQKMAEYLHYFDKKGRGEIYMPIYSARLWGFAELIMQLIHESSGKDKKGPTIIPVSAPESQHHSNQRYYGGKPNMQGLFLVLSDFKNKEKLTIPKPLINISLRGKKFSALNGLSFRRAMEAEFLGNWHDSVKRKLPASLIKMTNIDDFSIGYLTGFFHYLTVYLCWLNKVNPYDQPEVESSKEISFKTRFLKK